MKRLTVLAFLLLGAAFLFAQAPEAFIRDIAGTVELKTGGSPNWVAAKTGDRLGNDTVISTGFKSTALLSIGNSTLMVRPLTRLSLEALLVDQDNAETINLGLRTGRIQVDVNPPAGSRTSYNIQTPVATASVRGTKFSLDPVNLRVMEGTVSFKPLAGPATRPVTVNAGQQSWVDTDTGRAENPLAAAESKRGLPAMPGQAPGAGTENSPKPQSSYGTFSAGISLESIEGD